MSPSYSHEPPDGALPVAEPMVPKDIRVLAALLDQRDRKGRVTVRGVARATGYGLGTTHDSLLWLRDAGFVAWEPGTAGTLRPLVRVVPVPSGDASGCSQA